MMTKEQYQKFCDEADNMKIYDGRGTFDLYECEKSQSHKMITTYVDKGVTPFVTKCPYCGSAMQHTRTFKNVPEGTVVHNWVRPTYEQYCRLSQGAKSHVEQGGLIFETELIKK